MDELITLDYGSGGKKTSRLIEKTILPALDNPYLGELGDGAILPGAERLVFSTDSFVVDPLFFPGGDIGKLAVCGTVNDLAVCGAVPQYLSLSLIVEEGLLLCDLERVMASVSAAAKQAGVQVVTGDTKVVEKGRGDKLYLNTAGIGFLKYPGLSPRAIRERDAVLVSGTVGDHGTAVMLARSGLMQGNLQSDCAALNGLCEALLSSGAAVRVLRDPTRGGVATTLNEFIEGTPLGIELDEATRRGAGGLRAVGARPVLLRQRGEAPRRGGGGGRGAGAFGAAFPARGGKRRLHRLCDRELSRTTYGKNRAGRSARFAETDGGTAPKDMLTANCFVPLRATKQLGEHSLLSQRAKARFGRSWMNQRFLSSAQGVFEAAKLPQKRI